MNRTRLLAAMSVLACSGLLLFPASASAQAAVHDHQSHADAAPAAPAAGAVQHDDHAAAPQSMMEKHAAGKAKLEALVAKMNAATGEARIGAMADVLTALVEEHNGMACMMGGSGGMQHMEHMMGAKEGMMPNEHK